MRLYARVLLHTKRVLCCLFVFVAVPRIRVGQEKTGETLEVGGGGEKEGARHGSPEAEVRTLVEYRMIHNRVCFLLLCFPPAVVTV